MPERDADGSFPTGHLLAWAREHSRWIVALLLILFVIWRFPGKRPEDNGRYVLIKDDVPCQTVREGDDGRRWCYLVLDTRSGKLEERVRKVGNPKRK